MVKGDWSLFSGIRQRCRLPIIAKAAKQPGNKMAYKQPEEGPRSASATSTCSRLKRSKAGMRDEGLGRCQSRTIYKHTMMQRHWRTAYSGCIDGGSVFTACVVLFFQVDAHIALQAHKGVGH